jgi:hypothetical protein
MNSHLAWASVAFAGLITACAQTTLVTAPHLATPAGIVSSYPACRGLAGDDRWRTITPRLLLSHRSGLPNLPALEAHGTLRLHFNPGERFAYSGAGLNLLQFVEETGMPWRWEYGR